MAWRNDSQLGSPSHSGSPSQGALVIHLGSRLGSLSHLGSPSQRAHAFVIRLGSPGYSFRDSYSQFGSPSGAFDFCEC